MRVRPGSGSQACRIGFHAKGPPERRVMGRVRAKGEAMFEILEFKETRPPAPRATPAELVIALGLLLVFVAVLAAT